MKRALVTILIRCGLMILAEAFCLGYLRDSLRFEIFKLVQSCQSYTDPVLTAMVFNWCGYMDLEKTAVKDGFSYGILTGEFYDLIDKVLQARECVRDVIVLCTADMLASIPMAFATDVLRADLAVIRQKYVDYCGSLELLVRHSEWRISVGFIATRCLISIWYRLRLEMHKTLQWRWFWKRDLLFQP